MQVDSGKYNKDQKLYHKLITEIYDKYPEGVHLTPEYAQFVQEDGLRFLIRLARYKFAARQLKKTDRVLEVGSGSGLGSIFMGQHCREIIGLDVKTTEVAEASNINKRDNVRFICEDLFNYDPQEKFDIIVNLDVIEHMSVLAGRNFIHAMSNLLKPTGMLILGSPSIYSYQHQSPLSQASHIHCYDLPELVEQVEKDFGRTLTFSMNDEIVHTGHHKMAWYYYVLGFYPGKTDAK